MENVIWFKTFSLSCWEIDFSLDGDQLSESFPFPLQATIKGKCGEEIASTEAKAETAPNSWNGYWSLDR